MNDEGYAGVGGLEFAWMNKVKGDAQLYAEGETQYSYAVNVITSLRWPGSITVAKGGKFVSIYVGDGNKRGDFSYNPTDTPEVNDDPKQQEDQPEPQGKDPADDPQPVDGEGEEGDEDGDN